MSHGYDRPSETQRGNELKRWGKSQKDKKIKELSRERE